MANARDAKRVWKDTSVPSSEVATVCDSGELVSSGVFSENAGGPRHGGEVASVGTLR